MSGKSVGKDKTNLEHTAKSANALSNLRSIKEEFDTIKAPLKEFYKSFEAVFKTKGEFKRHPEKKGSNVENFSNAGVPYNEIIEHEKMSFEWLGIKFEVDFTLDASDSLNKSDLVVCIIYFVLRERQPHVLETNKKNWEYHGKYIERKAMISFNIDSDGRITSPGALEDQWWIYMPKGTKKEIQKLANHNFQMAAEIHNLALEKIWRKSLAWVNEDILP